MSDDGSGSLVWLCAIFFMAFCKTDPAQRRKRIGLAKKNLKIRWFISEKNIFEVRYFEAFRKKTTKSLKFMKIRKFYYVESYSKLYIFIIFWRFSSFFQNAENTWLQICFSPRWINGFSISFLLILFFFDARQLCFCRIPRKNTEIIKLEIRIYFHSSRRKP